MKANDNRGEKPRAPNPHGHYRKRPTPTVDEFAGYFKKDGDVPVLKRFLDGTADWVYVNFAPVELEVHQAATIGQAGRSNKKKPDLAAVKTQCPRLAIIATDDELKEIVGCSQGAPKVKELTAEIFGRVLQRSKESVKKWAQRKK
jgi:hypothetical protein